MNGILFNIILLYNSANTQIRVVICHQAKIAFYFGIGMISHFDHISGLFKSYIKHE